MSTTPPTKTGAEPKVAYDTDLGTMYRSTVETFLDSALGRTMRNEVQLIFTSPPFPLNRKKKYGNKVGEDYLSTFATSARSSRIPRVDRDGVAGR